MIFGYEFGRVCQSDIAGIAKDKLGGFDMNQKAVDYAADSAVMQTYGRAEIGFVRGEGCWLESDSGEKYLDCASGIAVNTLGHSHPHLVAALTGQRSNQMRMAMAKRVNSNPACTIEIFFT